ncbi:3',5'-cyclic-nucleotide phosphodiesterase [Methanosarcina sp. Ant1]|nr:3',5'-cyclic-nucleotide phosphodiesterase [Methanosarcina sp. Ant1]
MLESINLLKPDIVVITGDLTENGFSTEYNGAKNFVDRIECENKVLVPGNHDSKNAGYLHFEDLFENRFSSQNFRDVTVVGADSSQPDLNEGHIGRENYGWIKDAFSSENFKVFAVHHHLVPIPLAGRENTVLVDAGDVLELLNRCKVNLVLCGHCHIPHVWHLNNMLVVNAGTFCSSKTRGKTTQCYNLIQADNENSGGNWNVRVSRVFPQGDMELVTETVM